MTDWTTIGVAIASGSAGVIGALLSAILISNNTLKTTKLHMNASAAESQLERKFAARRVWLEPLHEAMASVLWTYESHRVARINHLYFEWIRTEQGELPEQFSELAEAAAAKDFDIAKTALKNA